jgi:hypothetical protein
MPQSDSIVARAHAGVHAIVGQALRQLADAGRAS